MPNTSNGLEFVMYYQEPQGDRFNLFFNPDNYSWTVKAIEGFAIRTIFENIRDAVKDLQSIDQRTPHQDEVLQRSLEELSKFHYSDDREGVTLAYRGLNKSHLFEQISKHMKPKPVAEFIFAGRLEQCVMYKNSIEPMEKQNFAKHLLFLTSHVYDAIAELQRRQELRNSEEADSEDRRIFGRGVSTYETSLKALLGYVPSYLVKLYHQGDVYFDETTRSRHGKNRCMWKEMQPTIDLIAETRKLLRDGMIAATRCRDYLMSPEARTEVPIAAMRNIANQAIGYIDFNHLPQELKPVMQLLLK
jgi:hypothetical protein